MASYWIYQKLAAIARNSVAEVIRDRFVHIEPGSHAKNGSEIDPVLVMRVGVDCNRAVINDGNRHGGTCLLGYRRIKLRSSLLDKRFFLILNYFAHLYFAQPTVASTVGNLLGDFAKGVDVQGLPEAIKAGLYNHRAIDRYTDKHPIIIDLKNIFNPRRRRFAGIALDVYFDHLLMNHWEAFDSRPVDEVIQTYYARMLEGQALMPNAHMRITTRRMVEYDWFSSYVEIESIAEALDRIASRIRFKNQFANAIEDLERSRELLQQGFLSFFPQLIEHVRSLAIESKGADTL